MSPKMLGKLLTIWMTEWDKTPGHVPFSRQIDSALAKAGHSSFEIKMELGRIASKLEKNRSPIEIKATQFWNRVRGYQEMAIQENLMGSIPGQIFLAKAQFGYTETSKHVVEGSMSLEEAIGGKTDG